MKKAVSFNPHQNPKHVSAEDMLNKLLGGPQQSPRFSTPPLAQSGEIVVIAGKKLDKIEYEGKSVVTLDMVAQVHKKNNR